MTGALPSSVFVLDTLNPFYLRSIRVYTVGVGCLIAFYMSLVLAALVIRLPFGHRLVPCSKRGCTVSTL